MPETSITTAQIKGIIDDLRSENEEYASEMDYETEQAFWGDLDTRVKGIGGGGLPHPQE